MITITRLQARRLRAVLRRHVFGIAHRGAIPPLVLRADGTQLRAHYRYGGLAVESTDAGDASSEGAIALPLDALAELEGGDASAVVLEAATMHRTIARWTDRGVPQVREFEVPALETLAPFPEPPDSWTPAPPALLDALAEASATTLPESTRYALHCMQLRGAAGEIAATDGRQLLVQRGHPFPWTEDLLLRRSPVFAARSLRAGETPAIGRTASHVVLRVGPWTLFLEVQAEGRFPVFGNIIPEAGAAASWVRFDREDVAFLRKALGRLPGAGDPEAPITLDLNGRIAVRAQDADSRQVTELVMTRSSYTGQPVQLNTNRGYLARALDLGLAEVEIVDARSPVVSRDANRTYCWQPLTPETAIAAGEDACRVDSAVSSSAESETKTIIPRARPSMSRRTDPAKNGAARSAAGNDRVSTECAAATNLTGLIQEAESLHETLTATRTRAGQLIVALRRYRRRERLVSTTLASLKALQLQDVAES